MTVYNPNTPPQKRFNVWLPLLIATTLAFGMSLGFKIKQGIGQAGGDGTPKTARELNEVIRYIEAKYVDEVDTDALVEEAIVNLLKDLDPHSNYISPDALAAVNEELDGNFEGIGIQFVVRDDTIYVVSALEGGPAKEVGVRAGDKIIQIGDSIVAGVGFTSDDVVKFLKGKKGSKVAIKVKRGLSANLLDFTITRDRIPIYSVDAGYMLTDAVGYIKISRFSATTAQEFMDKLEALSEQGMKHLVIDLRQNPGGYLNAATRILDQLFDEKKLLVYTQGMRYTKSEYKSSGRNFYDVDKIALLIDEGSASASEIMAGAIQDSDRGIIVGRRSFGKGLVQEQYNLSNGGALRLTVARYYTPSGRSIQKPYNDRETYAHEMYDRVETGELESADSITLADTTQYFTESGRVVYGGGGIMPDYFVPIEGFINNPAYVAAYPHIPSFVFDHLDEHRAEYKAFATLDDFVAKVKVGPALEREFKAYLLREGVKYAEADYAACRDKVLLLIRAQLAKAFFDLEGFYRVLNTDDDIVAKALKALQS